MLASILCFNGMSGVQGWFWFYRMSLQCFSHCEACQPREIQVKREIEKRCFSQFFNQFAPDLEKSPLQIKAEYNMTAFLFLTTEARWVSNLMLQMTSSILSVPSLKTSASVMIEKAAMDAWPSTTLSAKGKYNHVIVCISNATNTSWGSTVCWTLFKGEEGRWGLFSHELNNNELVWYWWEKVVISNRVKDYLKC